MLICGPFAASVTIAEGFQSHVVSRSERIDGIDALGGLPETAAAPEVFPAATDGYWMMLRPLPAGHHRLEFSAAYHQPGTPVGRMTQDIRYDLTIE